MISQRCLLLAWSCLLACAPAQVLWLSDSSNDVLYTVDPLTGAATQVGSTAPVGTPSGLAHDGVDLFTLDLGGGGLHRLDQATGAPTLLGTTGLSGWQDITWDPSTNQFFAVNQNDTLYAIDTAGNATLIGNTPPGFLLTAIAFDSSGVLWCIDFFGSGEIGTLDKTTGAYTQVAPSSLTGFQGISFHPATGELYGSNTNDDSLHIIDPLTGTVTLVGVHGGAPAVGFAKGLRWDLATIPMVPSVTVVGTGCTGAGGVTTLSTTQLPSLGNNAFTLSVTGAVPSSSATLFVACTLAPSPIPIGGGCLVYLDLAAMQLFINSGFGPFTAPTGPTGATSYLIPIPNNPSLAGAVFDAQAAAPDASMPSGFTTTNALTLLLY